MTVCGRRADQVVVRSGAHSDPMTTGLELTARPAGHMRPVRTGGRSVRLPPAAGQRVVAIAAVLAVVLRLPGVAWSPGLDESGFLMVARQWARAARRCTGTTGWIAAPARDAVPARSPARWPGEPAPAGLPGGCAHGGGSGTRRLRSRGPERGRSRRAASWAAMIAAVWLVTPLTGSREVNGELLAAPMVVWGIVAATAALAPTVTTTRSRAYAAASGVAAMAALLVKQNFVDVAVLCALTLLVGLRRRQLPLSAATGFAAWFGAGAGGAVAVAAGWTVAHGTSLSGVLWAMYPLRVVAGEVIAASGNPGPSMRLSLLVTAWLLSGLGAGDGRRGVGGRAPPPRQRPHGARPGGAGRV